MKKLVKYMGKWKKIILLATICMLLSSIFALIPFLVLNEVITNLVITSDFSTKTIVILCSIALGGYLLKASFISIGMKLSHKAAFGILYNMRKKYARNMIEHPMGQIMKNGVGRYKKGFVEDVELIETSLAHLIPEGIPYVIVASFIYIIIFITDWRLGIASLGVVPISLLLMGLMMNSGKIKMPKYFESIDNLNSTIVEYINAMEVVKIFNKTDASFVKYKKSVTDARDFTFDWYRTSWKSSALLYSILPATLLFVLPLGFIFYNLGTLRFEDFTLIIILNLALSDPLIKIVEFSPNVPQVKYALTKLEDTFASEPLKTGQISKLPTNFEIEIKDMNFAYEKVNIFEDFNLKIQQGERVAVVGESGSGKSTLAKLISHFWDVDKGGILIGGRDIREYTSETLMDMISYVSQDTILFSGTIMENLLMGNPNVTEETIIEVCKKAACHDFIINLKDGYSTEVGNLGKKLSGGERQRLTIVRAILKDAPIVILDEATAHTDAENEENIQNALDILLKDKIVIKIAHRLNLIKDCDRILVLNKGKIEADGTHNEVLEISDSYQKLWNRNVAALSWNISVKEVQNV